MLSLYLSPKVTILSGFHSIISLNWTVRIKLSEEHLLELKVEKNHILIIDKYFTTEGTVEGNPSFK